MEIQDKNSLLQQLMSVRFNNAPVLEGAESGFADMLKPDFSASQKPADKTELSFQREDFSKPEVKVKEKEDFSAKTENKKTEKEPVADKKEEPIKAKDKKVEQKAKEEVVPQETSAPAAKQEQTEPTEKANATVDAAAEGEQVTQETPMQEEAAPVLETAPVVQDVDVQQFFAGMVNADSADMVAEEELSLDMVETLPNQNIKSTAKTQTAEIATDIEIPQTQEDLLIAEQAQYIDKKVASPDKLKIEVSVTEEKIAAPMEKDILQNRFAVDSLFQDVEASAEVVDADVEVAADATAKSNVAIKLQNEQVVNPQMFKNFTAAETKVAGDGNSAQITNNTLAVSGKEVVFETANVQRNENFARLNEATQRDGVKGMTKEVVEQIKVNITKSAIKGVDTIDIQLKPEDLGKIQIKMHIAKDGKLRADIISSRPETMDMLQKDISGLERAFQDAGYDTDSRSFNFSFQKENQAGGEQKDDAGLLKFIGESLEQEAEALAGNDNLGYDPLRGLNIKV